MLLPQCRKPRLPVYISIHQPAHQLHSEVTQFACLDGLLGVITSTLLNRSDTLVRWHSYSPAQ